MRKIRQKVHNIVGNFKELDGDQGVNKGLECVDG